ncbi:MAG: hypothetical protein U0133_10715 [Gemmatimonadales bacterium]
MVQRSLPFLVLAGLVSCKGDPTGDLRNGTDHLLASPSSVFVTEGTTKFVVITAVDEQGNSVAAKFGDPQGAGAGVTVTRDLTYQPVYDDKGNLVAPKEVTSARYIVEAVANTANTSFTVSAGGKSVEVPVRITPATTAGIVTPSTVTPGTADTTTLTLPAPYKFSSNSVASIGGTALYKVSTSADSSTMRVVAGPGLNAVVSISNVVLGYAPASGTFTATSPAAVTTAAIPSVALNKTNAVAGDTIIVTAPAKYKFTSSSAPTVTGAGLASLGISADSSTLRFLIGPNANAAVSISNVRLAGALTLGPFTATSAAPLVTPAIPNFAGTFSSATPASRDTVTLTVPAGFKFLPTATLSNAGASPLIVSRSADSTQIRFVPARGTTAGPVTVTGIVLSFLRTVSLTLPTAASLTPPAALAGTGAIATAPTITLPAVGASTTIYDGLAFGGTNGVSGGVGNKFYKITVPASTSVTVSMQWTNTADIDILFGLSDGSDFQNCFAGATAANPETGTCTLPTGDTILFANLFAGTAPGLLKITLTRNN